MADPVRNESNDFQIVEKQHFASTAESRLLKSALEMEGVNTRGNGRPDTTVYCKLLTDADWGGPRPSPRPIPFELDNGESYRTGVARFKKAKPRNFAFGQRDRVKVYNNGVLTSQLLSIKRDIGRVISSLTGPGPPELLDMITPFSLLTGQGLFKQQVVKENTEKLFNLSDFVTTNLGRFCCPT